MNGQTFQSIDNKDYELRKITADTGCKIDIDDDGSIFIASEDINAIREREQAGLPTDRA